MAETGRRFRVRHILGSGAFGTVYRADALGSGDFTRPVAIKLLHRQYESQGHVVQRLRDEARMLATLKHRAIVRVDDLVQLDGSWAIVMELVDGVDLQRVSAYRPMPQGPAVEVVQEVASALRVAYEQEDEHGNPLRLLHRDIKPSNLSLTPSGEVRVLDFGIARAEIPGREAQTRSGLLGTPAYMAPECYDSGPEHASDVFALGATLYELLAGVMLGHTSVDPERHARLLDEAFADLDVHPDLLQLMREMLAYRAEERPTAREVERRLRTLRLALGEPWLADWAPGVVADVRAMSDPPDTSVAGTLLEEGSSETFQLAAGETAVPEPTLEPTPRRGAWVVVVGAALLLGVIGISAVGVGVAWWNPWRPEPAREPVPVAVPEPPVPEPVAAPAPAVPVPAEPEPRSVEPVPKPVEPAPKPVVVAPPPRPTPRPVQVPEPVAEPQPRVQRAEVAVAGAAEAVVLVAGSERYAVPGPVPPGTYTVEATFPGRAPAAAGQITLHADEQVTLECRTGFYLCQPR